MNRAQPRRWAGQFLGWVGLWLAWVVLSRNNHPTLLLNLSASGLLVATFAAAVYLNQRKLIPCFLRERRYGAYAAALVLAIASLSMICTIAIHLVYDRIWGPDPARFGFWTNFGLEFGLTALHVAIIGMANWVIRVSRTGRRPESGGGDFSPPDPSSRLTPSG